MSLIYRLQYQKGISLHGERRLGLDWEYQECESLDWFLDPLDLCLESIDSLLYRWFPGWCSVFLLLLLCSRGVCWGPWFFQLGWTWFLDCCISCFSFALPPHLPFKFQSQKKRMWIPQSHLLRDRMAHNWQEFAAQPSSLTIPLRLDLSISTYKVTGLI